MRVKSGFLSEVFVSFQGEGAHVGRRHLFVRTAGCNLRCVYCDTPDSLERVNSCTVYGKDGTTEIVANPLDADRTFSLIATRLGGDQPIDAVALTGGEPLLQADYLAEVFACGKVGVPVLLETNGVLPQQLERLIDHIDIVSMDIKPPSNTGEPAFWDKHSQFLRIARAKDTYIKVLVDDSTTDADLAAAGSVIGEEAGGLPVFLQPIITLDGQPAIGARRLAEAFALLRSFTTTVRVLPQTHKLLKLQ